MYNLELETKNTTSNDIRKLTKLVKEFSGKVISTKKTEYLYKRKIDIEPIFFRKLVSKLRKEEFKFSYKSVPSGNSKETTTKKSSSSKRSVKKRSSVKKSAKKLSNIIICPVKHVFSNKLGKCVSNASPTGKKIVECQQKIISYDLGLFKSGNLKTNQNTVVKTKQQALAIAYSKVKKQCQ